MPVPTSSRHNRPHSPTSSMIMTPARTTRTSSNYSNYTPTVTPASASGRMNVVTRVALEGKAKHGEDGAAIKMYLKMAVPLDSVVPGATIPLFPEENVKILSSQVHPLDHNSVPYNFSSTVSPLLHRAASALNLPARSQESFNSIFDFSFTHSNVSTPTSGRAAKLDNSEKIPPVDPLYTGHILVSGYNISYVLPKVFPSREQEEPYSRSSSRSRRPSISERGTVQFMAVIDMWVPYVTKPARHPYLLSIPTPRCLHNHIKLRIFPPNNTSNSYASLSSIEDEVTAWDLTSDPHVTRASTRLGRTGSYNNFADDESSDSSVTGFSEGCGIQGTFPSAERIRIRWAKPSKPLNLPGEGRDGRRRVGVKHVKGEMTCIIRGKSTFGSAEGVLIDVSYTGSCSGVWFPGVATMLGMDIGLETKGCDVVWAEGNSSVWEISGGTGYTGFDVGPSTNDPTQPTSRGSSFGSNGQDSDLGASNGSVNGFLTAPQGSRISSTSSTASLLRAPLPTAGPGEYSFEGSTSSLPNSSPMTLSSINSVTLSTPGLNRHSSPPGLPLTLYLNINELLPPAKNLLTFTISGTILLIPRSSLSRINGTQSRSSSPSEGSSTTIDPAVVMLPKFTVLAADSETTSTIVRNEIETPHAAVEVYHATGDIHRDAQAKKTVLQKTGVTKCGNEGARIVVKDHDPFKRDDALAPPSHRPSTPSSSRRQRSPPSESGPSSVTPTISVVKAVVVPFHSGSSSPVVYSVSLKLHVPVVKDSDWLEFGFAHGTSEDLAKGSRPPKLQLVSATADGIPVEVETSVSTEVEVSHYGVGFERLSGKEWASWIKLKVAGMQGSEVAVEYLVKEDPEEKGSSKGKARGKGECLPLLLPTFALPIGKFDVKVCSVRDFEVLNAISNFKYHQASSDGYRLTQFSVEEFFYPQLSPNFTRTKVSRSKVAPYFIATWILFALTLFVAVKPLSRYQEIESLNPEVHPAPPLDLEPVTSTATVTITSTAYETTTLHYTSVVTSQLPIQSNSLPTLPTSSPRPTITPSFSTVKSTPSSTPPPSLPNLGLQPFRDALPFSWPHDFSAAMDLYDKVAQAASVVWKYLRKAYHYPLEAP